MDIKTRLETEHSKTLTLAIIKYVGDDPIRFKKLIELMLGDDPMSLVKAMNFLYLEDFL